MAIPITARSLAVASTLGLAFVLVAGTASAQTETGASTYYGATTYYVDCSAGNDSASGTSAAAPWRSLARVNAATFRPGDVIQFRAGTTCNGTLAPHGSGTTAAPIVARSYGTGPDARIDGQGATAAVLLHNVEGWELRHLDITSTGPAPAADQQRVGIQVLLEDYGTGHHYVVADVNVHDVQGCDCRDPHASGGILFSAEGSTTPTGFDDVQVRRNTVTHVDRTGIGTVSSWQKRSIYPNGPGSTWVPMTGVVIADNTVSDAGGDGIMVFNGSEARVVRNTVNGFNTRSADYNVGMYAWNSDHTVFQNNDVGHGKSPGMAFDIEGANVNTVYQYNFSHDNGGGFLFVCPSNGAASSGGVVRYNISQNDNGGSFLAVITAPCGDVPNTRIYNNTIYAPGATTMVNTVSPTTFRLTNNIFVGSAAGSAFADPYDTYTNNLYRNVSTLPSHTSGGVSADPLLTAPGTAVSAGTADGYRLRTGSPAIGAGASLADSGASDYFGNPIPSTPSIGAYQGPPVSG
ncbi:hypothetical protein AAW14_27475 [Streptomyces hygroscopicus]|uniref:right-handed parallel beta-helix repeat-containing protein n=1 Tax=Streptomyces hygroscopicus TaxID=1912 RepID=UPI0022403652|nr:right-handed parallel beta-helix repeat-containing protein [Streptomyces hygroscopicus]MCW7945649.1 hypothetical protein [Streptomyces hygroscopicus]